MDSSKQPWDKKAKNYSRYTEKDDNFESNILLKLEENGVVFEHKTLFDIGCGTGIYTLRVAKKCLHVEALDSSNEMLKILQDDAKKHNINNITTVHSTFDDYSFQNNFDIALCTMSPAVRNEIHFQKMTDCSEQKIYLGWAGKRDSQILNELFKAHNATYKAPNGSKDLENFLEKNKIDYQMFPYEETRITSRNLKKSIENFSWHLEVRGVTPNIEIIAKILSSYVNESNEIEDTTLNTMNLIVWK